MRLINYLLFLLIISFSCKKNIDFNSVKLIGHAGMGISIQNSFYHDNSNESINLALSINGCDGVEVDVQISLDTSAWLYHNPYLESETNISGFISLKYDYELHHAKYKSIHHEKMIQLKDINSKKLKNKSLLLDIKNYNNISESMIIDALKKVDFIFSPDIELKIIINKYNEITSFINSGFPVICEIQHFNEYYNLLSQYPDIYGFAIKNKDITSSQVEEIKKSGKEIYLFEIRAPKSIRNALLKFSTAVITDDLRATILEKF